MSKASEKPLHRRLMASVAVALLPLAVLSAAVVIVLGKQQEEEIELATIQKMRAMASAVDGELFQSVAALETLATSRHLAVDDFEAFYEEARRVATNREDWATVLLADPNGNQLLTVVRPFGSKLPPHLDPESLLRMRRTKESVIGNVAKSQVSGQFLFSVSVPILRDGKLVYALSATIEPDSVLQVIEQQRVPKDGVVSILDANGRHAARSRSHAGYLAHPASPTLQAMMKQGDEGWGPSTTLEGQRIYAAFSRSRRTGWTVAVGIPAHDIDFAVRRSYIGLALGFALSLIFGGLASGLLARRIAAPIAELSRLAEYLGRGEVPPAFRTSIPEVRRVAEAMTAAADARRGAETAREDLLRREREARAIAEEANRVKDEFLAMLGHELRNPLGAIANAARVLETHPESDAAIKARVIMRRQIDHLSRLVDDLLDVARVMKGKFVLDLCPVEVSTTVRGALEALRSAEHLAHHAISVEAEEVWCHADPVRLEQIVTNLVVNAVKYTPPGGTIRIKVLRDGGDAVIEVADDGIGMDEQLLPRVFDLFAQGTRTLDRSQGGLGIGLTLVRRLVELHDGQVQASSKGTGEGSAFTVRLPAMERPPDSSAPRTAPPAARSVLLVDDNEDSREMLAALLEHAGHTVYQSADGPSGVEAALRERPSVALVDIGLPGFDGFEVARRVRASEVGKDILLVALTGYGSPSDRQRALDAGFDEHLVKPVETNQLYRVLSVSKSDQG